MSVLSAIGNTPLVELTELSPNPKVRLLAKLEGNNPGGSVKDRPALWMIEQAERTGDLTPDKILLEPTSGNTGIGVAMVAAAKGYRCKLTMPECVSLERRNVLRVFGAELVLTPAARSTDGAIEKAWKILAGDPEQYFMPNQFANPANVLAHYESTGPEIWEQTGGAVTHFVAGIGTTGTLMGVSRCLKERNERVQVIGMEPVERHTIQGLKNLTESAVPAIFEPKRLAERRLVGDDAAFQMAQRLARHHGLFVGMSGGAAAWGAVEVAKDLDEGTVVFLLPDRGDRYLSTVLFRSICAQCPP